jgi:hypothetical protein
MVHNIFATEYSREFSVQPIETKRHGAVSDMIVMLYGKSVLARIW